MIITIVHVKKAFNGVCCAPGLKRWFVARELDFKDFVRNGIDEEILAATGDAFALEVIKAAKNVG